MENKKSLSITPTQKEVLTEYISQRPEMYMGRFTPTYTREIMNNNWREVTNILNSIPKGPAKDWRQWRKTWVDIKKNTKSRAIKAKNHARCTGGGPSLPPNPEDDIDQKILNIIPSVNIRGDENIQESLVSFLEEEDVVTYDGVNCDVENKNTNIIISEQRQSDHIYCANNEVEKIQEKTATTSYSHIVETQSSPIVKKKMRINKSLRLEQSLKTNSKFIDINQEKFKSDKLYQEKKIYIMETKINNKKAYQERKASALENIASSLAKIADKFTKTKF